jgi:hypothetical protein
VCKPPFLSRKVWSWNALKICFGPFALIYKTHISVVLLPVQICQNFLNINETLKMQCEATQRSQWNFLLYVVNISNTVLCKLNIYLSVMLGSFKWRCLMFSPFNSLYKAFSCVAGCSWWSRLYKCFYSVWDLKFSRWWRCWYWCSQLWHHVDLQVGTSISEEHNCHQQQIWRQCPPKHCYPLVSPCGITFQKTNMNCMIVVWKLSKLFSQLSNFNFFTF